MKIKQFSLYWLTLFAGLLTALFLYSTGLISGYANIYSGNMAYRLQTEAFLNRSLTIGSNVTNVPHDYTYNEGSVNQVWGLGVPLLRLPFELISRKLKLGLFPDRVVFGMVLFTTILFSLYICKIYRFTINNYIFSVITISVLLSPVFIALCKTRFDVYEEAVAFCYCFVFIMFFLLKLYVRKNNKFIYLFICVVAGYAPFIRPTAVFYSLVTIIISFVIEFKIYKRFFVALQGLILFSIFIVFLLLTNYVRFGSILEFGHKLNITESRAIYLTRFETHFKNESAVKSLLELVAISFYRTDFNDHNFLKQSFFKRQSLNLRWRELYFTLYDRLDIGIIIVAVIFLFYSLINCNFSFVRKVDVLWSLGALCLLIVFYSKNPIITSRYILDLSPSLSITFLFAYRYLIQFITPYFKNIKYFILAFVLLRYLNQIYHIKIATGYEQNKCITQLEAKNLLVYSQKNLNDSRVIPGLKLQNGVASTHKLVDDRNRPFNTMCFMCVEINSVRIKIKLKDYHIKINPRCIVGLNEWILIKTINEPDDIVTFYFKSPLIHNKINNLGFINFIPVEHYQKVYLDGATVIEITGQNEN